MRIARIGLFGATMIATALALSPVTANAETTNTNSGWSVTVDDEPADPVIDIDDPEPVSEIDLAGCQFALYKPVIVNRVVKATGWTHNCYQYANWYLELQRHRWWGWQKLASKSFQGNKSITLRKGCSANDLYTYRLWGKSTDSGAQGFSPKLRKRC